MSDETLAPEAPQAPLWRNAAFVGPLAFLGGVGAAAAALALSGGLSPRPAPTPAATTQPAAQARPNVPALPPATDVATLDAREAALAARLDAIELRIRDADGSARGAASYATRAERLMIAFAVRRQIERGLPLGALDSQLRARFGDHPEAIAAIAAAAAQPVTLEDLRLALDAIGPRLFSGPDDGLWARVRRMLGDLVVLRQADVPSPRAADRLRRARRALDEGKVEAALGEIAHMPGGANAESWVTAARRYIAARGALGEIERAAMDMPPAPQPAR